MATKERKIMHRLAPIYESKVTICGLPVVRGGPTPKSGNEWTISADPAWPAKHRMEPCEVCYGPPYIGLLKRPARRADRRD